MAAVALLVCGCGKKGPPLPPIRILPAAARDLDVRQVGDQVIVSAVVSMVRTDGTPLAPGAEVRVLRMPATEGLRAGAVSQRYLLRQFEKQARAVATLRGAAVEGAQVAGRLRAADMEAITEERSGRRRFLYSLQVVEASGKRSSVAVPRSIEVAQPPPAPAGLSATPAEGEVRLAWEAVAAPQGGTAPQYNLYRAATDSPADPADPLNAEPLKAPAYVDTSARYGVSYRYFARAVLKSGGPRIESADSEPVQVRPLDVYPPATPTGLAVTAEGTVIKVYWFPNSETDLGGYRIYRREASEPQATLVGTAGPTETSYADATARPGVRYYYAVTAVDSATPPNESGRSEERSDILPIPGSQPEGPGALRAPRPAPSPTPPGGRR